MKATIHLVHLQNCSIFQQLQMEEALLRADQRNWCLLNTGSSPAIIMGISGKPELLIDSKRLLHHPIPIIRRFSGGGTVVIDNDTCFTTFICNSSALEISCCPREIMEWTATFYRPVFANFDFSLKENDYILGNKKFGGNAQYLCKNRWLHHTSLLWGFDPWYMEYLLIPSKVPNYRQRRSHEEFLCRLKDHIKEKTELTQHIIHQLQLHFHIEEIEPHKLQEVLARPHRKTTTYVNLVDPEKV